MPIKLALLSMTTEAQREGAALGKRLAGANKAQFARDHKIPGGPSMLSQNISGNRPISLEAGIAYARAFKVPLADISQRLAAMVTAALTVDVGEVPTGPPTLQVSLEVLADACAAVPANVRANALELLALVVTNPESNATDQIPIIVRKLSGETLPTAVGQN